MADSQFRSQRAHHLDGLLKFPSRNKAEFEQPVEKAPMFRTISKLPSSLAFRPGRLLQAACLAEEPQ
jgi:hypothetical protein